jgi:hypothetical protein
MPLTIPENIDIAEVSTYLAADNLSDGQLYGKRLDANLPMTIEMVLYAVKWRYLMEGVIPETKAIGRIEITDAGNNLDTMGVFVDDPILGLIQILFYVQNGTYNIAQTVQAIVNTFYLYWNIEGYEMVVNGNFVDIYARQGLGASINGNNNLQVIFGNTPNFPHIFDNTFSNIFN